MKNTLFISLLLLSIVGCSRNETTAFDQPPAWAKNVIWYQIFVERFNNGDTTNDPKPENMDMPTNERLYA